MRFFRATLSLCVFASLVSARPAGSVEPEDDEVGRAALGWFTLARRPSYVSSGVFRTGLPRRDCYWQTKEYNRLPPALRVSQIGKRVRLTFRFEDGRKAIVGTALLVRPRQNSPRRLGCRR